MGGLASFFGGGGSKQSPASVWGTQAPYLQALYGGALGLAGQQLGMGSLPQQTPQNGFIPQGARPAYGSRAGQGYVQNGRYVPFNSPQAAQPPGPTAGQGMAPGVSQAQGGGNWTSQLQMPGPGGNTGISGAGLPPGATTAGIPGSSAQQPVSPIQQASQGVSGGLFNWLGQGSPYLQGQINSFGQNLGNFWNQQILPGINQNSSYYGGTGGARQGIAQGIAGQGLLQQYQQGVTGLQSADYANNLANVGSLYNLGMAPWSAAWQPLQQFGSLLGGPTVLGGGGQQQGPGLGYNVLGSFFQGLGSS